MKFLLTGLLIAVTAMPALAQNSPLFLQIKYSPLATVNDGEENADKSENEYQRYDINYDHTLGAKLIYDPVYISVQHNIAKLNNSTSDATLETFSMGFAGFNYERLAGLYLMGSLGVGAGKFKLDDSDANKWETLLEAGAEIGIRAQDRILLGMGVDYQRFGEFGDHKANYWNLYLATGIVF